ncbi:MAG: hypothetical protein AB7S26_21665 [Sandaracinaceae bacterium]
MPSRWLGCLLTLATLNACAGCGSSSTAASTGTNDPSREPPASSGPARYEVHEWGLVRGMLNDRVMLSGPHRAEIAMPLAKPVLYFHREGEGALTIDVGARITHGSMVEHWPLAEVASDGSIAWSGVTIEEGNCAGAHYPSESEAPCSSIVAPDSCEAAVLATVETPDGDCVRYRDASYDHLFYRGELAGAPAFPLEITSDAGRVRVTHRGSEPIVGRLLRVNRTSRQSRLLDPPAPGASAEVGPADGPIAPAIDALADALRQAGLTDDEVSAFRRAWDETLFGTEVAAGEAPATATPMAGGLLRASTDEALLYVLPSAVADALAPLTFDPPPTAVRRAIVVWIDVAGGAVARP